MRDNLHDDLFADHAWQEMHKVLDREMPEHKRRGFLFWLLPALGFCVLLGRDTMVNTKIPVASEKPKQSTRAIAQGDETRVIKAELRSKTNPEKPALETAQNQSETQTTNPVVAELAKAVAPALQRNKKGIQKLPLLPQPNQQQPGFLAEQNAELAPTISMPTVPDASNKEQEAVTDVLSTAEKAPESTAIHTAEEAKISSSDPIATRQFDLDTREAKTEHPDITPLHAKQKLEWWAETGTQMTGGISGLSGYRAGLLMGIPIGKLRLRVGAEYQNTEVDFKAVQRDVAGRESLTDVKLASPSTPVTAGNNADQTQTVSSIHLQFINLSLSVYQPLGKRFGLAAGGSMLYLEGIRLGDQYVKGPFFNTSNAKYDFANSLNNGFLGQQAGSLSKSNFKTFGFALQGEFSYRIATRWGVNLGYRHSLQHFTKSAELLLKPNWVDLGVRYRIR
ncbi:outer membrane beta-barrel protein [Haliscomenobacter hydrossis]|uniref:Outer membrane protein beta-barrel domain-containing protein n=1 Tax=Haliscomenobacter hydrossis (strain ATCC 27775 / DSM 1100 / LMG 10767 / O) TaxID=760192 RepID=F4KUQ7_HALH1|nr:outer membrane beta-barrel protein [Haliscomenobacter hydrossis]AEE53460.1 hypothetical protein Halhy_5637 [Haliscomenobacter hydrossis DSM 1100]